VQPANPALPRKWLLKQCVVVVVVVVVVVATVNREGFSNGIDWCLKLFFFNIRPRQALTVRIAFKYAVLMYKFLHRS